MYNLRRSAHNEEGIHILLWNMQAEAETSPLFDLSLPVGRAGRDMLGLFAQWSSSMSPRMEARRSMLPSCMRLRVYEYTGKR